MVNVLTTTWNVFVSRSVRRDIVNLRIIGLNDAVVGVGRSLRRISPIAKLLLLVDNSWFALRQLIWLVSYLLDCEQKTIIHQIKLLEECHILFDLFLNFVNVASFELDEVFDFLLFVAFYSLKIDVFKGGSIFDLFCDLDLSVDNRSF